MVKQMSGEAIRQFYSNARDMDKADAFKYLVAATGYTAQEVRDILTAEKVVLAGRAGK